MSAGMTCRHCCRYRRHRRHQDGRHLWMWLILERWQHVELQEREHQLNVANCSSAC